MLSGLLPVVIYVRIEMGPFISNEYHFSLSDLQIFLNRLYYSCLCLYYYIFSELFLMDRLIRFCQQLVGSVFPVIVGVSLCSTKCILWQCPICVASWPFLCHRGTMWLLLKLPIQASFAFSGRFLLWWFCAGFQIRPTGSIC